MTGLLLIDKPAGWTSFDVVNYVRKMVAQAEGKKPKHVKVGHTGTLDPAATGLLVLAVGKEYTKQMPVLMKHDKTYIVEMTLGKVSTTGDSEGKVSDGTSRQPTQEEVDAVLGECVGEQLQTPPAFSAIKVDGQRAYDLARAGKPVTLAARPITVYSMELTDYQYPLVHFTCRVSSGTYIRSLVETIGKKLQTGAYMSGLRRSAIADWSITDAVAPEGLSIELLEKLLQANR